MLLIFGFLDLIFSQIKYIDNNQIFQSECDMLLQQKCNNNGVEESSKQQINCTNRMCHLFVGWGG